MIFQILCEFVERPAPMIVDGGERPNPLSVQDNGPRWSMDAGERGVPCSFDLGERGCLFDGGPGWDIAPAPANGPGETGKVVLH